MNKNFLILFVFLAIFYYDAQLLKTADTQTANIHLRVNGMSSGTVSLTIDADDNLSIIDSTRIDKYGNIYFQRENPYDPGLYHVNLPDGKRIKVLINEDQIFTMTTSIDDMVDDMWVSGSRENELMYKSLKSDPAKQIILAAGL